MIVYRSPRGAVFHKLKHWNDDHGAQLPPTLACRFDIVFNDFWVQQSIEKVPPGQICCKCFPERHSHLASRRPNQASKLRAVAKIALEKWREYRNLANWDRGVDESGEELRTIERYEKELGLA